MDISLSIPEFSIHESDQSERWSEYINKIKIFFRIKKVTDVKEQLQYLLFTAGKDVIKLYDRIKKSDESEGFGEIVKKIADTFNPTSNVTFNIFHFRSIQQMEHEPFSEFYTKLQDKLEFCKFPTPDFEMKHQIIQGCFSKKLRTHTLSNPNLTIAEIVEKATIDENIQTQSELFNHLNQFMP